MASRTNLAKIVENPDAGKHYLFKDGQFVNEWSNKTVADITIYVNGASSAYTATLQNGNIAIPAISLGTYGDSVIEMPEIPSTTMASKDHLIVHFTDKNFVELPNTASCAFGHTNTSLSGVRLLETGNYSKVFHVPSGYCTFMGGQSLGTNYTYTCAKEVFSDDTSDKHFVVVSTEESDETEPHMPFLAMGCGNATNIPAFAISEVYMENID